MKLGIFSISLFPYELLGVSNGFASFFSLVLFSQGFLYHVVMEKF